MTAVKPLSPEQYGIVWAHWLDHGKGYCVYCRRRSWSPGRFWKHINAKHYAVDQYSPYHDVWVRVQEGHS